MTDFATLRPKTCSYLTDDKMKIKNRKTQKSVS